MHYSSYYTYCSKKMWIILLIFITVLLFLLYVLFSKTRPVTFISTGLILIGTQEYPLNQYIALIRKLSNSRMYPSILQPSSIKVRNGCHGIYDTANEKVPKSLKRDYLVGLNTTQCIIFLGKKLIVKRK